MNLVQIRLTDSANIVYPDKMIPELENPDTKMGICSVIAPVNVRLEKKLRCDKS